MSYFITLFSIDSTNVKTRKVLEFEDENVELDCTNGTRITAFVCLSSGYYKATSPKGDGETLIQINSSLGLRHLREVDVIDRSMTLDMWFTFYWVDNRIKKKFTKANMDMHSRGKAATLILPIEKLDQIWTPDFYIFDMKYFESYKVITSVNSISLLYNYWWSPTQFLMEYTKNNTVIQYYIDARVKVYCHDFEFKKFPFEENNCTFLLGTSMYKAHFIWGEGDDWRVEMTKGEVANGYRVTEVSWINEYPGNVNEEYSGMGKAIGFTINMKRKVWSYAITYYIPCALIVMLTQTSFIVPLSSIPGRVALLVTEFLTLTNIFIHQQVTN